MSAPALPPLAPSLAVSDAARAIDFYKAAFGAVERYRLVDKSNGKIGHAEITIDGFLVMLADEYPGFNVSPATLGGTSVRLHLMCEDVDGVFARAVEAGATAIALPEDQFYGHRLARVRDPFGHEWMLSRQIEEVSPEEMQRRFDKMVGQ